MRKHLFPLFAILVFSFFYSFIPSLLDNSETLQKVSLNIRDVFFSVRHLSGKTQKIKNDVVLVAIDQESCDKLRARWPWSRHLLASLVDGLARNGARVIGINIAFTGLEESGDESSLDLARAIKTHGAVVLGATFDESNRLIKPARVLNDSAARVGYLEKIVDPDFTIRRSYLLRPYSIQDSLRGEDNYSQTTLFESSFPLDVATLSMNLKKSQDMRFDIDTGLFAYGQPLQTLWIETDGSYTVNYLYKESDFLKIPAWKVLEGLSTREKIEGKIVLVGVTSSLLGDSHPTPFGIMPGIGIHANELISILSGRNLRFIPKEAAFLISWLSAALILLLFLFRRFWIAFLSAILFFGIFFFVTQSLLARDILIEPSILGLGPLLGVVFGVTVNSLRLLLDNQGLERKAVHDKLTGLYTYDFLRLRLEEEWKRCRKSKTPISLVMTDLDRFKKINDTLGHEVGNEMIRRASRVLKDSVRGYDIVSRYGGDEFVILLWHSNAEEALLYRERLRQQYHEMAKALEDALKDSSISIGVATFDPSKNSNVPPDPQALIELADKDLYRDKESRRKK